MKEETEAFHLKLLSDVIHPQRQHRNRTGASAVKYYEWVNSKLKLHADC